MTWLLANWKPLVIILLIGAIYGYGYYRGSAKIKAEWELEKVQQTAANEAALVDAQKSVISKERHDQLITGEVENAYQTKINTIDNLYAATFNSLSISPQAPTSNSLSSGGSTSAGYNGATCPNGLSRADKTLIVKSSHNAEVQTARLVACQSFIRNHL